MRGIIISYSVLAIVAAALIGGCLAYYKRPVEDPFKADAAAFIAAAKQVR